ncbi:MAG: NfeD family protein, partial [Bacteroidales bacterium]|nr:NfeD family protein [Bacteroidales bacterium]
LGLVSIGGGIYMAFARYGQTTGLIVLGCVIVVSGLVTWLTLRSKTWKEISLKERIDSRTLTNPAESGISRGSTGITLSRLAPMGKVRFNNTDYEATSRKGIIERGKHVEVVEVEGIKIIVKEVDSRERDGQRKTN